jgi:hypothetical protein
MILPAIKWRHSPDELWAPARLIARQDYDDVQLNQMVLRSGSWPERKLMNVEDGHDLEVGDQVQLRIRHQTLGERTRPVGFNGTVFSVLAPPSTPPAATLPNSRARKASGSSEPQPPNMTAPRLPN